MNDLSHPTMYLLALERTGWRRYVFGRWVYPSEPFRRDIQRQIAEGQFKLIQAKHERYYPPEDL